MSTKRESSCDIAAKREGRGQLTRVSLTMDRVMNIIAYTSVFSMAWYRSRVENHVRSGEPAHIGDTLSGNSKNYVFIFLVYLF